MGCICYQMLRPEGADSFGRRNMLNNANEVSETLGFLPHAIAALEFLPPREQSERTLEIESTHIKIARACARVIFISSLSCQAILLRKP